MNGIRCAGEPFHIFLESVQFEGGEILRGICGWVTQGFEKSGADEDRDLMLLESKHPSRLFRRQTGGKKCQSQELSLFGVHGGASRIADRYRLAACAPRMALPLSRV